MRVGSGEWRDALLHELETAFSREQLEAANELVKDESRFIGKHNGVDYVFASRPHGPEHATTHDAYITSVYRDECSCPARKYEKTCYHLAAALSLTIWGAGAAEELRG